ncbi:MAG: nuclear transport factor 2 family protein [Patulibacter sp.]
MQADRASTPNDHGSVTLEALAARLAAWEDERAVVAVLTAYGHAIDAGDEAAWLDCFTDDARFSTSGAGRGRMAFDVSGRPALEDFVSRHSRRPHGFQEHLMLNPVIRFPATDEAHVVSRFLVLMRHEQRPAIRAFGRYEDTLRREPGGTWRIVHRHAHIDGADDGLPRIAMVDPADVPW